MGHELLRFSFCNHLNLNCIKTLLSKPFFLKNSTFTFLTPKRLNKRKLFKNTAKRSPFRMNMYRQKFVSNLLAFGKKIMSLKSDRLEIGLSLVV